MFTPAVHNGLKGFPDLLVPPQPLRLLLLQHLSPSKHVEYFVRPEGVCHQWRKEPPGELSIGPVADERLDRATERAEAS